MAASFNSPWDIAARSSIVGIIDASEYQPVSVGRTSCSFVQAAIGPKPADGSQSRPNSPSHLDRIYAMCESFRADLANLVSAVASAVASFFGCSSRSAQDANVGPSEVTSQRHVEPSKPQIRLAPQGRKAYPKVAEPKRVTYTSLEEYQNAIAKYEGTPKPDPLGTLIAKTVKSPTLPACIEEMQTNYQQLYRQINMILELLNMERDPGQKGEWPNNWKVSLEEDLRTCIGTFNILKTEIDTLVEHVDSNPATSIPSAGLQQEEPLAGLQTLQTECRKTTETLLKLTDFKGLADLLILKHNKEEKILRLLENLQASSPVSPEQEVATTILSDEKPGSSECNTGSGGTATSSLFSLAFSFVPNLTNTTTAASPTFSHFAIAGIKFSAAPIGEQLQKNPLISAKDLA